MRVGRDSAIGVQCIKIILSQAVEDLIVQFAVARAQGEQGMAKSDEAAIRKRIADERTERGRARYREVMLSEAPPPVSPFTDKGVVDAVFAELWSRPWGRTPPRGQIRWRP